MTMRPPQQGHGGRWSAADHIIAGDRYILSSRIRTLTAIRDKLRPPPVREPMPPLRHYGPPRAGRRRRG
jgi:hypothetical protein